jgi:hypothetical protein
MALNRKRVAIEKMLPMNLQSAVYWLPPIRFLLACLGVPTMFH